MSTTNDLWRPAVGDLWFPRYLREDVNFPPRARNITRSIKTLDIVGPRVLIIFSITNYVWPKSNSIVFMCDDCEFWECDYTNFINWCYNAENEEYHAKVHGKKKNVRSKK